MRSGWSWPLAACGGGGDEKKTFALVPKAMNNPFFDQARDGCKAAEAELPDVECLYTGPGEHSEEEQVQIVEDLVTRRVDGIAVAPSNAPAMARAFERAREAGIPVITWDSDLLPEDRHLRATYIGTENRKLGVEQARVLQRLAPSGGTLCIQSGGPAAQNLNERMQGIRDTLSGRESAAAPGDRARRRRRMDRGRRLPALHQRRLHARRPADGRHAGALPRPHRFRRDRRLAAVRGSGLPPGRRASPRADRVAKRTIVIVADTLPMQMALLRDGLSHAQVGQRPREMGYRAMEVLRDLAAGGKVEDPIYTGLDVCTEENAATCVGSAASP